MRLRIAIHVLLSGCIRLQAAQAAETQKHYYAHDAVEDKYGVIAPWYDGQNGQCDYRVRIAAETMKRYPWTDASHSVAPAPHYIYSGAWKISQDGKITVPAIKDWSNGDFGQRAAYVLGGMVDYYRYSGDPAAVAIINIQAEALLDNCLTPVDHPWPKFLISVPNKGKPYGPANPHGFIQLDIVGETGVALIHAAQLAGNTRWLDAAKHWGDLLAEKRNREPGLPPWGRYANPEDVPWEDRNTGSIVFILDFLDALIRIGHTGKNNSIVEARNAGVAYLRDVLLPKWTDGDTWGRSYWDWNCPVQTQSVTEFAVRYLMTHPNEFPSWRTDARNILSLFLNRTSVSPQSNADVYSGAWAYPESSQCCGRSLWYGPLKVANAFAQYGVLADSEWGRELARRQTILSTYDVHDTGVVEDKIDGGQIVAGDWFKIAHPLALKQTLAAMAWLPEVLGPCRENHIVRSSSVVTSVTYSDGWISYTTADAPANTVDVLRLSFQPTAIKAGFPGEPLSLQTDGKANGYQIKELKCGDFIVTVRHDGIKYIDIEGNDPQHHPGPVTFTGAWSRSVQKGFSGGSTQAAATSGATVSHTFTGNQVRLIGRAEPDGGLADVYLDDVKQLVGIDCWCPDTRAYHVLYYKNGLPAGQHTLKVVVRGEKNPRSSGTKIYVDGMHWSAAEGKNSFGKGGGPTDAQRFIFGYAGREDFVDSEGHAWRPATEFVVRAGPLIDSVATWWTSRRQLQIDGTPDPELYRYGVHAKEFWANVTVGPGTYYARLKFAETRNIEKKQRAMTIRINGKTVVENLDIVATAAEHDKPTPLDPKQTWIGMHRAVDLVFNDIEPKNGVIEIKFTGVGGEAIVQAIEIGLGPGGTGATPQTIPASEFGSPTPAKK